MSKLVIAIPLVLALSGIGWAQAHTRVLAQTPAPDTTVEAPAQVCLSFHGAIEAALSRLVVTNQAGQPVATGAPDIQAGQDTRVCVRLPALAAGAYHVQWAAVARDGHRIKGQYTFHVR